MKQENINQKISGFYTEFNLDKDDSDYAFSIRLKEGMGSLRKLYESIYGNEPEIDDYFYRLLRTIFEAYVSRSPNLKKRDKDKLAKGNWFLSNELVGMSLYVDRFCGKINDLNGKLSYLEELGVNFLHLMPLFESPEGESDGGYAVSDFRKVSPRFGSLKDLQGLVHTLHEKGMNLMLDIVLNHTSHRHEWAEKAKSGDSYYQDYYYMYDNRWIPNQYEVAMPEIFPESAPGNFTWSEECQKWVMTVFHGYQWDLNFRNPQVLREMLDTIFFYANLGVDLLRIDAPAFIWKETGTSCQNLPQAHAILQLIKQAVQMSSPGMAILGEAIVAPAAIMEYFGEGEQEGKECDFTYNATQMALQWDMLASGETEVMLQAQPILSQKPYGCSWISYTRCHDDIGLGYDDYMIAKAGKDPFLHRRFLKDYFIGNTLGSPARGALFSSNPRTDDARISGTLASLCGLEKSLEENDQGQINLSIQKILLMQAHSFFLGGLPMIFYGDELGYTNDYSYQNDPGKSYDNRWMHRPQITWETALKIKERGTVEERIFSGTQRLIQIRKDLSAIGDYNNLLWLGLQNKHITGYLRSLGEQRIYVVFNFSTQFQDLTWYVFKEQGLIPRKLWDHWNEEFLQVGLDNEFLHLAPYEFRILEVKD
ncbi:alpha-amylase family glycosyl hydrolase [Algoriphagus hitonicola]|uniref:Amylosucrase n=1 Tax=Algoriphagus hitonicola TaxID=435880 RepID=A0A1I2VR52_9BACT|nr:alpha-amylase family glycosyl hydrolase [Algoriphagus hitonicola]SFG91513.1 amylosucrase [Algoriphagus hitonicola]